MQEVWGSNPHSSTIVTSRDIEDTVNPRWVTVFSFWGRMAAGATSGRAAWQAGPPAGHLVAVALKLLAEAAG